MVWRRKLISAAALAALCASSSVASAAIKPGKYCSRDALTTSSGDDLGEATADAEIRRAGSALTLSFSNSMPDSGQDVDIGTVQLRPAPKGGFNFRFKDNWGADGVGTLKPIRTGIRVDIERTGKASDGWGDNAGRNYGVTDLRRAPCRSSR